MSAVMDDVDIWPVFPTESDKVEAWRLHVLIRAGYPVILAERIAVRLDVDLHRAVELVGGGCKYAVAADILL